jgi:hypothetical protein
LNKNKNPKIVAFLGEANVQMFDMKNNVWVSALTIKQSEITKDKPSYVDTRLYNNPTKQNKQIYSTQKYVFQP